MRERRTVPDNRLRPDYVAALGDMLIARERVSWGILAGVIGAALAGSLMRAFGHVAATTHPEALAAALAGAIGLTWGVCVLGSRRRLERQP